jgi:hypothetical protein
VSLTDLETDQHRDGFAAKDFIAHKAGRRGRGRTAPAQGRWPPHAVRALRGLRRSTHCLCDRYASDVISLSSHALRSLELTLQSSKLQTPDE